MDWFWRRILIFSLLISEQLLGYPAPVDFDGNLLRWNIDADSPPIYYEVKISDPDEASLLLQIVGDAARQWSSIRNSYFKFHPVPLGVTAQITLNYESQIQGGSYASGYTVFDEYEGDEPKHCSIYIASNYNVSIYSLQKTTLHELGHCMGLGHSLNPKSIMSYKLFINDFKLDTDDYAAVTRLYPLDHSGGTLPPGCAIGGQTAPLSSIFVIFMLLLPLLRLLFL